MLHRLRRRYALAFTTLARARTSIALAAGLFAAGGLAATSVDLWRPTWNRAGLSQHALSWGLISSLYAHRFLDLFAHNVIASYASLLLGRFGRVFPLLFVFANGAFLGAALTLALGHHLFVEAALNMAPHGVFEIPAVILAGALGIWIGTPTGGAQGSTAAYTQRRRGNAVFLLLIIPLLAIAAAIEALRP